MTSFVSKLSPITADITSADQQKVALALSDLMIEQVRANEALGGANIADRLVRLRDIAWKGDEKENYLDDAVRKKPSAAAEAYAFSKMQASKEDRTKEYQELLNGLSTDQTKQLAVGYAQLGQLFEVAGSVAKENYFTERTTNGKRKPGGIADLLSNGECPFSDASDAVQWLNTPVFEPIFTQHPTNVVTLPAIQALRHLSSAACNRDKELINEAMQEFLSVPLTPVDKDGKPANFTVFDETNIVINFLNNIYDDLPNTYAEFDTALAKKFSNYKPEELQLKLNIGSWGSAGDKDGNKNIKSENTLEAVALHRRAIIEHYIHDLQSIGAPIDGNWLQQLESKQIKIARVIHAIEAKRQQGNDIPLTQEEFDSYAKSIAETARLIDAQTFSKYVEAAYKQAIPEHKQALLNLKRRIDTFGFGFGKIEYRETAEEYTRVIDRLIGYQLKGQDRTKAIADIIENRPEILQQAAQEFLANVDESKLRSYSKDDADAITYHTLKRMQLARDFPDMIKDNVLAECKGTANMLEAVALQVAVGGGGKERAKLGVVPLFEESDTLEAAPKIVKHALENSAYQQHLRKVYPDSDFKQQVQIAHSDNARRTGVAGARGFIHAAHEKLRDALKDMQLDGSPVQLQFYEGGSQSDAYRNGVRAISAMVNAFDIHDFAKMTFQGGDLNNYFNHTTSITRLLERHFTHAAKQLATKNGRSHALERIAPLEALVHKALQDTLPDYVKDHFNESGNQIGRLFAHPDVNFVRESQAQNVGSRSPSRGDSGAAAVDLETIPTPVNTQDMRTIGFSECFGSALGIVASWLGAEHLYDKLNHAYTAMGSKVKDLVVTDKTTKNAVQIFDASHFNPSLRQFTPESLHLLYDNSPAYRDTIDKLAYGILMSDMKKLSSLDAERASNEQRTDPYLKTYVKNLMQHYCQVSELVYQSLTGKDYPHQHAAQPSLEDCERARFAIKHTEEMNYLDLMDSKQRYREFEAVLRENPAFNEDLAVRRAAHAATDTVYHGRGPADDITCAMAFKRDRKQGASLAA